VVVTAFAVTAGRDSGSTPSPTVLPALTPPAPERSDDATIAACAKVIDALPVELDGLVPRKVFTERAVAWGNPPVVLRCGVNRPAELRPGSAALLFDIAGPRGGSVEWLPNALKDPTTFTTVDRAVYIEVSKPLSVQSPLASLSDAIASVLPPVCSGQQPNGEAVPPSQLCVNRPT
jgi:hypothetical protein